MAGCVAVGRQSRNAGKDLVNPGYQLKNTQGFERLYGVFKCLVRVLRQGVVIPVRPGDQVTGVREGSSCLIAIVGDVLADVITVGVRDHHDLDIFRAHAKCVQAIDKLARLSCVIMWTRAHSRIYQYGRSSTGRANQMPTPLRSVKAVRVQREFPVWIPSRCRDL